VWRDSSLSTMTGLRAENPSNRGSIPDRCKVFDSTPKLHPPPHPPGPTQSSIQWAMGFLSARVQLLWRQADAPTAEVKNVWSYSSTHPSAFISFAGNSYQYYSRTKFLRTWETRPIMELINITFLILTSINIFEIFTDTL